ncbi:MAG TPA: hypothetical protein VJ904_03095, partial [Tichowtungia sp.]|nr:hypothetical protein [Tichowtungia sp.]
MKYFNRLVWILFIFAVCRASGLDRPDYYTAGFYTRGSDEVTYVDQGGVIDPFWIPVGDLVLIPRVTLEVSGDDNYFLNSTNETDTTQVRLMPGALLMYGRPEHNHLYLDTGADIPIDDSVNGKTSLFAKLGGVYQTGKSKINGSAGYRQMDEGNQLVGRRLRSENLLLNAGAEYRLSMKTSLGAQGYASFNRYDDSDYTDYHRYYGAGRIHYQLTCKTDLYIQAGGGVDRRDRDQMTNTSDADFQDISIGMRGKPSPKTSVNGSIGFRFRQHDDPAMDDVNTWIANFGASVTPFGLSVFGLELSADGYPDVTGNAGTLMNKRAMFSVNRRLFTERLRGHAAMQFGVLESYTTGSPDESDYWGYTVGLD